MSTKKSAKVKASVKAPAFWLVWRDDAYRSDPTHKHATEATAREEAERLARLNPGKRFFILPALDYTECVVLPAAWSVARKETPWTPSDNDETPF